MIIAHLVAVSENNVIGKNNQLPWHLPDDFKFFKNTTWGMPVIMGRKTFESMEKELPGRINIVVTKNPAWQKDNVITCASLEDALNRAADTDCNEIFIIGGGEIFRQSLDLANTLYITRVHTTIEGDTFYSEIDKSRWQIFSEDFHEADAKHQYSFTFQTWKLKA